MREGTKKTLEDTTTSTLEKTILRTKLDSYIHVSKPPTIIQTYSHSVITRQNIHRRTPQLQKHRKTSHHNKRTAKAKNKLAILLRTPSSALLNLLIARCLSAVRTRVRLALCCGIHFTISKFKRGASNGGTHAASESFRNKPLKPGQEPPMRVFPMGTNPYPPNLLVP
jgi:hypothetical protein